ncbi:hypothetical protein MIR68_004359 [Amoeboaphelidium protococcarum]|nr:hypothetical protein MIR68_004359 [Amoeboaphelidium protococcarum]
MTLLRDLLRHTPASTVISSKRTDTQLSAPSNPRELVGVELKLWKSFDQDVMIPYRKYTQPHLDMDCQIKIDQRTVMVGSEATYWDDPSCRCILPIEIKTMWAFDVDDDLVDFTHQGEIKKKVLRQEYGYMSVNHNRYGIICTADKFFFLRRGGFDGRQQSKLEVSSAVHRDQNAPFTLMEAVCAMFQLCENKDQCMYASPYTTPVMMRKHEFDLSVVESVNLHEVYFEQVVGGSDLSSVVFGGIHTLFRSDGNRPTEIRSHQLVLKMADSTKDPEHLKVDAIDYENQCYLKLSRLQGTVIPRLLARLSIDGWIEAIMIERLERVSTVADIKAHYSQLINSLQSIHQNGVAHGDVAPRNIMWKGDQLLLIDFGHAKLASQMSEQEFLQMCTRDIEMLSGIAGL